MGEREGKADLGRRGGQGERKWEEEKERDRGAETRTIS